MIRFLTCVVFLFNSVVIAGDHRFVNCAPKQFVISQPAIVAQPVTSSVGAAATQQIANSTTVVNNLVGIPVPVQYSSPIAAQGGTVYGYQNISDYYNQVDMGLLYNQAARLTDQAQQLAGQATVDFQTLIHAEGQYRSQVAQILAQGQIAQQALLAAKPQATIVNKQRSFSFKITQDDNGDFNVERIEEKPSVNIQDFSLVKPQQSQSDLSSAVSNLLTAKCVKCHNNEKASGGLNLLGSISQQQQLKILESVNASDPSVRMPKKADGSPGERLSDEELSILSQTMGK